MDDETGRWELEVTHPPHMHIHPETDSERETEVISCFYRLGDKTLFLLVITPFLLVITLVILVITLYLLLGVSEADEGDRDSTEPV